MFTLCLVLIILSPSLIISGTPTWPIGILLIFAVVLITDFAISSVIAPKDSPPTTKRILRILALAGFSISFYLFIGIVLAQGSHPSAWFQNAITWTGEFDYLMSDGDRLGK